MGYICTTTTTSTAGSDVCKDLGDLFFDSFCMSEKDRFRMGREFYDPKHIAITGNYWPRYRNTLMTVSLRGLPGPAIPQLPRAQPVQGPVRELQVHENPQDLISFRPLKPTCQVSPSASQAVTPH